MVNGRSGGMAEESTLCSANVPSMILPLQRNTAALTDTAGEDVGSVRL